MKAASKVEPAKPAKAKPVDMTTERLWDPKVSLSFSRLEITASCKSKARLCLVSFKIDRAKFKVARNFAKHVKAAIDSAGGATKADVLSMRAEWRRTKGL
jgi:hypothetical protein